MIENNIRFAENLKKLRNMWNESQKSFSAWAGVSEGNIYHWESGRTIPDVEMLGRIAAHFAVTVEQLLYYDFSDFEVAPLPSDKDRIIKTAVSFFYRVSTIEAQKNPDFQAGYKLDKQLWKDDQLTVEEFRLRIENVTSYYINALDSGIAEAACNIMCYLLIAWFSFTNPVVIEKFATIPNEPGMVRNLFKRIKQGELPAYPAQIKKARTRFLIEKNDLILKCMYEMKQSKKWSELADYYLALLYFADMVDNECSSDTNQNFGIELMDKFADYGNKYARRFFESIAELYPEEEI